MGDFNNDLGSTGEIFPHELAHQVGRGELGVVAEDRLPVIAGRLH